MSYTIKKTLAKNSAAEVLLTDFKGVMHDCTALVKTVLPPLTEGTIERLQFAQSLSNPGIAEIVDYGECKNSFPQKSYVATKYVPAVTLRQVLSRLDTLQKKAPIPFVVHIVSSVCTTLEYLHGIIIDRKAKRTAVHGGICLDTIVITMNGDICLVDTGFADLVRYRFTGTELVDNTPSLFFHPELTEDIPVRKHHEIYAVGLLLFCMLIGKNHFEGFCDGNLREKFKSVGQFFPSIPRELDRIIERATKCKGLGRFARYDSIAAFGNDLLAYSNNESVTYDREMTSLIVYALFNHLENEPDDHHEMQRNRAMEYFKHGNDNALKMLLAELLKINKDTGTLYEDHNDFIVGDDMAHNNEFINHLALDMELAHLSDFNDRETLYMADLGMAGSEQRVAENPTAPVYQQPYYAPSMPLYQPPIVVQPVPQQVAVSPAEPLPAITRAPESKSPVKPPVVRMPYIAPVNAPPLHPQPSMQQSAQQHHYKPVKKPPEATGAAIGQPPGVAAPEEFTDAVRAFSTIITRQQVIDATIYTEAPSQKPEQQKSKEHKKSVPYKTASPLEPFAHLLKNNPTSSETKHLESFSNLLKKEHKTT